MAGNASKRTDIGESTTYASSGFFQKIKKGQKKKKRESATYRAELC